ncbi:LOW QUALITY PROTEIN: transmembrane protein 174 [Pempheris klunzingeri]|uniref:LOW QUALITY PROTEIN: transmembrane protein 174 n=1 Tax=Pempheris klunzingeri TaxID=3127111 RepID=UPI0039808AF7
MDQQGPQGFWTNMVVQRPVMETNSARNPTTVLNVPPGDLTQMVTPAPRPHQSDSLSDYKKTGAALLFSGVFLFLVGATFTIMGFQQYKTTPTFTPTQLLGPILLSVGGTFIFSSVCRFGVLSCWPCRQLDEEVLVLPVMEQTSTGHSFTLSHINQPIMFHGATTIPCIPPSYNYVTQEVCHVCELQPGGSMNGVHAAIPPHDAVCPVDNTNCRRSR